MQTHIDLVFADGTYRCALGLAQIHELQTKCGAGIGAIFARVMQGRVGDDVSVSNPAYAAFYVDDVVEVVRQGLIGGGSAWVDDAEIKVGPMRANDLVNRYLLEMPLADQWNLAAAILHAKINGYEDKKKAAPSPPPEATPAGGSTIPPP